MALTILSEADVKALFREFTADDVTNLSAIMSQALAKLSNGSERQYQPSRSVIVRPNGQATLFMPATTEQSVGVKVVGIKPSTDTSTSDGKPQPALQSALNISDAYGRLFGVLNAAELTAFRTALGSMLLYRLRKATSNIVVFGAGKQALWHIWLAMILRGDDIKKVTIINRSVQRASDLRQSLHDLGCPAHVHIDIVGGDKASDAKELEAIVTAADVIFCTTPSTMPLFPASFLTSESGRGKSRFISAIGSYRLDMQEIDPDLLKEVANPQGVFSNQSWKGLIAVDSADGCLEEAGELVAAGISREQMLEVGQIHTDMEQQSSSADRQGWLRSGFVIYKSVGVGIMDIVIGEFLINLAKERNIGCTLPTF